jgi:hypothetical protein
LKEDPFRAELCLADFPTCTAFFAEAVGLVARTEVLRAGFDALRTTDVFCVFFAPALAEAFFLTGFFEAFFLEELAIVFCRKQ